MANANELSVEITDAAALLVKRKESHGAESVTRIANAMALGFKTKLNNLPGMSAVQAMEMQDAIEMCPFEDTVKESLLKAVDTALQSAACSIPAKLGSKSQTILHPHLYMIQEIIDVLLDPSSCPMNAEEMVCTQYRRLGVTRLCEQSRKWLVAFLVLFESRRTSSFKSYQKIYDDVCRIQSVLAACSCGDMPHTLAKYPDNPKGLPQVLFDQAYPKDHPVTFEAPRLSIIANNHIPLRSSSKLLKQESSGHVSSVSGRRRSNGAFADDDVVTMSQLRDIMCRRELDHTRNARQLTTPPHPRRGSFLDALQGESPPPDHGYYDANAVPCAKHLLQPATGRQPLLSIADAAVHSAAITSQQTTGTRAGPVVKKEQVETRPTAEVPLPLATPTPVSTPGVASRESDLPAQPPHGPAPAQPTSLALEEAALNALMERGKKRKAEKKEEKAAAAPKKSAKTVCKRPAAAPDLVDKAAAPIKRVEFSKLPEPTEFPLDYNGGRIYCSAARKQFRVIRSKGAFATEAPVRWRADTPTQESWEAALAVIDEARAEEE